MDFQLCLNLDVMHMTEEEILKLIHQNKYFQAYNFFNQKNLMLEKFIPFKLEVSVIAARNTKGEIKTFPLVENIHEDNILRLTIAPARVSKNIANLAEEIAKLR